MAGGGGGGGGHLSNYISVMYMKNYKKWKGFQTNFGGQGRSSNQQSHRVGEREI